METYNTNQPLEEGLWESSQQFNGYANFWLRFAAMLIDSILMTFVSYAIMGLLAAGFFVSNTSILTDTSDEPFSDEVAVAFIAGYLGLMGIMLLGQWLYYALMESSKYQGTLGKMAVNIKVTDYDGNRISFLRATGRYFSKIISGLILYIGYIMAGFTERKQALHDMMASTLVVNK